MGEDEVVRGAALARVAAKRQLVNAQLPGQVTRLSLSTSTDTIDQALPPLRRHHFFQTFFNTRTNSSNPSTMAEDGEKDPQELVTKPFKFVTGELSLGHPRYTQAPN